MCDLINIDGLLVSREKEWSDYFPITIGFKKPISDESMRLLAAFAYDLAKGDKEGK